ncbi:hypothetical protein N7447_009782 [Penicillium robsamsonii]|uniref:uncharacterized protein n=1 Tax=Penicillium robsamsonii TaxID=1792511 RepID=UPI0025470B32|nr:uncharacterized protein N7447_009782 [Penicillium robsamsonii]KAJ5812759.1 hypothetical protein N7447_009782 [Penicillium robsamsonii]
MATPWMSSVLTPKQVVTAVLQEANNKKALCLKMRWKVEFRGKTIVLRDLSRTICAWSKDGDVDGFEAFLEQDPDLSIPSDFPSTLIEMLQNRVGEKCMQSLVEVLLRYGKVNFTPEYRRDIDELLQLQSESDLNRLLLGLEHESQG